MTMDSSLGVVATVSSVLVFGVTAMLVQFVDMHVLALLQLRGALQWVLALLCIASRFTTAKLSNGGGEERPLLKDTTEKGDPEAADSDGASDADDSHTLTLLFGPKKHRPLVFLRAALYWLFMGLWWRSLQLLPLGDATTIGNTFPFFTMIFACMCLSEQTRKRSAKEWCYSVILCGVALFGIMLISTPHFAALTGAHSINPVGVAFALGGAVVNALMVVVVKLSNEVHWSAIEHTTALLSTFVLTPIALLVFPHATGESAWAETDLSRGSVLLVFFIASLEFLGLVLETIGFQAADVVHASILNMVEVPWSYTLQVFVRGEALRPVSVGGAALILSAVTCQSILQSSTGELQVFDSPHELTGDARTAMKRQLSGDA